MNVMLILVNMATAQMVSTVTLVNARLDILELTALLVCAYYYCYQQCVVYNQYTELIKLLLLIELFYYELAGVPSVARVNKVTISQKTL